MISGKKVVATIEARMTSMRLPGKVLLPLAGKPVLQHMIERHRRSAYTDEVVVATTANATDDVIVALCEQLGCAHFRGSEEDCLARIVGAGEQYGADILVQGFADSPAFDWRLVDRAVEMLVAADADCASNEFTNTYAVGLGVRVYKFATLREAEKIDTDPAYREHAGYSIRTQPDQFVHAGFEASEEQRSSDLRVTLDTQEDYALLSALFDALYPGNPDFTAEEVVRFLRAHPEVAALNSAIEQKKPAVSS